MSVEVGSRFKSVDGKEFGIVTISRSLFNINAYLQVSGDEIALDSINIKSIIEILFGSLNKEQQKNILKMLLEEIK